MPSSSVTFFLWGTLYVASTFFIMSSFSWTYSGLHLSISDVATILIISSTINCSTGQDRQCMCNMTLRDICITTVVMEKQQVLHILSCGYILSYPACKVYVPYYIVICGLSSSTICFYIISYMAQFSEKSYWTWMRVWIFSIILSKTFLILIRIQHDIITNLHRSSCKIPIILVTVQWNLKFPLHIFKKSSNIKFHESTSTGSWVIPCRRIDRQAWQS
jgi:hypothetical protein